MSAMDPTFIGSERCAAAFGRMFWAFLFFSPEIRFRAGSLSFDILPDFIGWLLLASSLEEIFAMAPEVRGLRTISHWMAFLSLSNLVHIEIPIGRSSVAEYTASIATPWPFGIICGIVMSILYVLLVWKLLGLIMGMAAAVGNDQIYERADFRRKFATALAIMSVPFAFGVVFMLPLIVNFVAILALLGIVNTCLLLGLLSSTARMCRDLATEMPL
jgi:hypothetical protein